MYETRAFEFEGRSYEVRIASDGFTTHIRVFFNGKPVNGYTYSVDLETRLDAKMTKALINPLEEMIKTAINDVKEKTWERYLEAIKDIK